MNRIDHKLMKEGVKMRGKEHLEDASKETFFNSEHSGLNEDDLLSLIAMIIAEYILNEDIE